MSDIEISQQGSLGRITLNRPGAINALTPGMLRGIDSALDGWADDPAVRAMLIDGAGERGLCAGGDIRFLYNSIKAGDFESADGFIALEYRLNARIAGLAKPFIALMDGLVMGGGVGISAHGSARIVTERTRLAMPEVGIGFLPDIGATFLLSAAPGEFGTHVALTGEALAASDIISCGLADHHVATDRLPFLIAALRRCPDEAAIRDCIGAHATPPAPGRLDADAGWIEACYSHDDVQAVLDALRARPEAAARQAAGRILGNCPTSLAVTLRALRQGRRHGRLEPCLQQEYRLGSGLMRRADFCEGVRAAVIDKDRKPRWQPAAGAAELEALFGFEPPRPLALA